MKNIILKNLKKNYTKILKNIMSTRKKIVFGKKLLEIET